MSADEYYQVSDDSKKQGPQHDHKRPEGKTSQNVQANNRTCRGVWVNSGTERGQPDSQSWEWGSGPAPKEGQAPSQRPRVDAKLRYMPAAPKGPSKESRLKKSKEMDQATESRDSSGPYLASKTVSLPAKTDNIVPKWRNSWQRRNRGNMALPNTPMWIAARLLEEEPAVSIGLLQIWTQPSKLNEAMHQRVQEINRMADQEAIAML
jgi:hypothetical protein